MLAPDLAGFLRHAAIGLEVLGRNWHDESINILGHQILLFGGVLIEANKRAAVRRTAARDSFAKFPAR
jgi:hypothetical protein